MVSYRKFQVLSVAVLGLSLAVACTSKKSSGGDDSSGKEEKEVKSDPSPSPSPSPSGGCLRLQDEFEADDDTDTDSDSDTSSSSDTASDTSSDTSSDSASGVDDCGTTVPTDTASGGGSVSNYNVGPGIDGCKDQGAVWIAVSGSGTEKAGACGDPLADFCCTEDNVYALFPSMASQLKTKFSGYSGAGLKLYGCSVSSGKYAFHFANNGDAGIAYKSAYVTGVSPKTGVTPPASCPAVTIEDLGFSTATETSTDTETTSSTDTSTSTGTTAIPASIGELTDTSEDGVFEFLKTRKYAAWDASAKINSTATSVHKGYTKIFFNAKMKSSDHGWVDGTTEKHTNASIAVIELYNSSISTKVKGWGLLAKAKDETGKDSWLMVGITGTPDNYDDSESKGFGMGASECASCHNTASRDYIKTHRP